MVSQISSTTSRRASMLHRCANPLVKLTSVATICQKRLKPMDSNMEFQVASASVPKSYSTHRADHLKRDQRQLPCTQKRTETSQQAPRKTETTTGEESTQPRMHSAMVRRRYQTVRSTLSTTNELKTPSQRLSSSKRPSKM